MQKTLLLILCILSIITFSGCATKGNPDIMTDETANRSDGVSMINNNTTESCKTCTGSDRTREGMESMESDESMMIDSAGVYQDYDRQAVDSALAAGQKVLLFFHASRCPSCKSLDIAIKQNIAKLPEDTVIFKVDYDTSTALKQEYGVRSQHTTVRIDRDKKMISLEQGGNIETVIKQLQ